LGRLKVPGTLRTLRSRRCSSHSTCHARSSKAVRIAAGRGGRARHGEHAGTGGPRRGRPRGTRPSALRRSLASAARRRVAASLRFRPRRPDLPNERQSQAAPRGFRAIKAPEPILRPLPFEVRPSQARLGPAAEAAQDQPGGPSRPGPRSRAGP
jgi:hypothetical protein